MGQKKIDPNLVFVILCLFNFLNFVDRGIIPGSSEAINLFIQSDISTSTPNTYLGLLQSSFYVGFVVGVLIFGHLIHYHSRFLLLGIGMNIWIASMVLSGLSRYGGSYACLAVARFLSGFGQSVLQTAVPPWIEATAPFVNRGTWLAIFAALMPIGTAIGFVYSSNLSAGIGWQYAYFINAIVSFPLVTVLFYLVPQYPYESQAQFGSAKSTPLVSPESSERSVTPLFNQHGDSTVPVDQQPKYEQETPTFKAELFCVITNPVYLCLALSNSTVAACVNGIVPFGSAFMMGLGYFETQSQASTVFGALVSVSGLVGSLLGVIILDRMLRMTDNNMTSAENNNYSSVGSANDVNGRNRESTEYIRLSVQSGKDRNSVNVDNFEVVEHFSTEEQRDESDVIIEHNNNTESNNFDTQQNYASEKPLFDHNSENTLLHLKVIFRLVFCAMLFGTILLCITYFIHNKGLYIFVTFIGVLCIFLTYSSMSLGVMSSIPQLHRSFALAMNIVIARAIGDIPSPIVIGYVKDDLAPGCIAHNSDDNESVAASDACRADDQGLRLTLLMAYAYMFVGVVSILVGWLIVNQKIAELKKNKVNASTEIAEVSERHVEMLVL